MARAKAVGADTSGPLRDQALGNLTTLIQAVADARRDLRSYQSVLEKVERHIGAGGRASDISALFDVAAVRTTFSDRLNCIERARSASRLTLWRMQSSEGRNIADIARAWGFSRQLVSRALADRSRAVRGPAHGG